MSETRQTRLDPGNPVPLYFQICQHFRQRIRLGRLQPGEKLPSEKDIETAFGVSRITAQRALNELAKEGLVDRQRGKGTTVSRTLPPNGLVGDFSGLRQGTADIAETTRVEVLSFEMVPAETTVARALSLPHGTDVQRAIRLRWSGNKPFSYSVAHTPKKIGSTFTAGDLTHHPMLELLEAAGVTLVEADQTVTASNASPQIASALKVPVRAAVLRISRVLFEASGAPVQHIDVYYRPDAYSLRMRTTAMGGSDPDGGLGEL